MDDKTLQKALKVGRFADDGMMPFGELIIVLLAMFTMQKHSRFRSHRCNGRELLKDCRSFKLARVQDCSHGGQSE